MAGKPRKPRPNRKVIALSDARSGNIFEANRTVGYARVASTDQAGGLAAQRRDLKAVGAERVFSECAGSTAPRPKLAAAITSLSPGDVLMVTRPDRLAPSPAALLVIEQDLAKRGIRLLILSVGGVRLDTRESASKRVLTVLRGVAAWQREAMLERQREGIARGKAEGKFKGRPPSVDRTRLRKLLTRMGPADVARTMGIARSTVYKLSV